MIVVFRYGHRIDRDKRVTTHCALVARAFGADKIVYCGEKDKKFEESIEDVVERWGGNFKVEFVRNWEKEIKKYKEKGFLIVHLTMYGIGLRSFFRMVRKKELDNILVIVGSEKVPSEFYQLADFNVSVTNQPHSEIAALSLFLYFLNPAVLSKSFEKEHFKGCKIQIVPTNKGKRVKEIK